MDEVPARGNLLGKWVPARYILAALGSIGMAIIYGLKVNLSVALVGMLNHTALAAAGAHESTAGHAAMPQEEACKSANATVAPEDGPFTWSEPLQGMILSCYFWGYFVSQVPGGRIAEVFSAKWVMFFSVLINIVCTLLTPVMAQASHIAVIAMRIGEGIGGGVTFPAMHVLLSRWAPPAERGVLSAVVYAGTALGTVLSMLLAGVLSANLGWESIFYVMGGLACIWCFLWVFLIQDTPQKQPFIDQEERDMIAKVLGTGNTHDGKRMAVPWKAVLTSPPFLAILVAHTCSNWGWYMLLIELPFYMKQVLKFNITENAVTTAIPFLTLWIFSLCLSRTLDYLKAQGKITTTTSRKIGTLFASLVPMVCLLGLCYVGCHHSVAVGLMALGVTCIGGMFCGFLSNHIDIAPNFAGTLMALTNTAATLPGIIVPLFVGHLTHGNQTISAWRIIFFVTIALYIVEILVYTIFGSGEEQAWNRPANTGDDHVEGQPLNEKNKEDSKLTGRD